MSFLRRCFQFLMSNLPSWYASMRHDEIIETAQHRTLAIGGVFLLVFAVISIRLFDVMILNTRDTSTQAIASGMAAAAQRADILDRHGEILATQIVTASVYANPRVIMNPAEVAEKLSAVLPQYKSRHQKKILLDKLSSNRGFIWVFRHISPQQQHAIHQLGIPGLYLQKDYKRVYPHGPLVSHVVGYHGIDNKGLSGIEKKFDTQLHCDQKPVQLSIDVRVQHIVREELYKGVQEFKAEGGSAIVMDADTGEILAMVSLPDFDPNTPNKNRIETTFNRNTLGIYEAGSTFKIFNTAIALETGRVTPSSIYDASTPIRIGRQKISDFYGKNRPLQVREVFVYSSNIGSAKMALDFGSEMQKEYLERFGLLKPSAIELPEVGAPLLPAQWTDIATMTISYGYGIAVSPIMLIDAVRGVIKGEVRGTATLLKRNSREVATDSKEDTCTDAPRRIVSEKTALQMRELMRLAVTEGTAGKANVPAYEVIGKTGTAHKNSGRRGYGKARISSFVGAFPKDNPRYVLVVFLDNPQPTKSTHGFATGGWTAAPISGNIIARLGPLLDVHPIAPANMDHGLYRNLIAIKHNVD